jgi:LytS/YehU family sensor histidine kinase
MMQTRYGDNLHIERHIDPACNNLNIIPLSIQLLIENALKHNVVSDRYPLTIRIETLSPLPNEPVVRVSNVVRLKQEEEQGNGVGLVNLSKRYMLQYNKDITISNVDNVFSVDVPLVATKSEMA